MAAAAEDVPEAAVDPSTKDLIAWFARIVVWVVKPVATLIHQLLLFASRAFLALVRLIYQPLSFVLAPFFYIARFLLACLQAPFQFIAKFETLYIYLSVGALIGIACGLLLSIIFRLLQSPLGLDSTPVPSGRTAKEYREQRQKEQSKANSLPLSSSADPSPSGYFDSSHRTKKSDKGRGLVAQTIAEVESDY